MEKTRDCMGDFRIQVWEKSKRIWQKTFHDNG